MTTPRSKNSSTIHKLFVWLTHFVEKLPREIAEVHIIRKMLTTSYHGYHLMIIIRNYQKDSNLEQKLQGKISLYNL